MYIINIKNNPMYEKMALLNVYLNFFGTINGLLMYVLKSHINMIL